MLLPLASPRVRHTSHNTQLTFNLPYRLHVIKTYPVLSPQGATILILGHLSGITILWLGGRRFKPTAIGEQSPDSNNVHDGRGKKRNGSIESSTMIIDPDGDEKGFLFTSAAERKPANSLIPGDTPVFEDGIEIGPYPEVVQTLDLPFGAAVLHVAVLPMAPCSSKDAAWEGVELLREQMIFVVSCASNEVYVVILPLTPPTPGSKVRPVLKNDILGGRAGSGAWGETVILLAGQSARSDGVAVTVASRPLYGKNISRAAAEARVVNNPYLIIAAHTHETCGALRLWELSLDDVLKGNVWQQLPPFQTEFLAAPLSNISFNPKHTTQLLTVFRNQAVRVYDFAVAPGPTDDLTHIAPFASQGSWLLSLYAPFARPSASRKPVVDAAWVAHGRAVLALLADGTWGVWDIDGSKNIGLGPTVVGRQSLNLRGGAITAFSATGFMEGMGPLRGAADAPEFRSGGSGGGSQGDFVPMTPHTRRDAAVSMGSMAAPERLSSVRGGICVITLPISDGAEGSCIRAGCCGGRQAEESAILWLSGAEHVCVIPGLSRFWNAQLRRGAGGGVNLFSGAHPTRMIRLHDLSMGLLGERCAGVAALLVRHGTDPDNGHGGDRLPIEVVLCGESRFVIVREADDGPSMRLGGVVDRRRRWTGGKTLGLPRAIVVHSRAGGMPDTAKFDLTVSKKKLLLTRKRQQQQEERQDRQSDAEFSGEWATALPTRPRLVMGLAFLDSMSAAADAKDEQASRDVEVEMLDIMNIDRQLVDMEEQRYSGRKRVLFDEA